MYSVYRANFHTLFFQNEHALFLFKAPRQSVSVLIYGGENSCVRLAGGPTKPVPLTPPHPTPLQSGAVALNMLQLKPGSQEASVFKSQCLQVLNYSLDTIH